MIIPVPALWSRQTPEDPNDRIERVLYNRSHRLMAGLSIDERFRTVEGALIVSVGNGKYLRLQHAAPASVRIPAAISGTIRAFFEEASNDLAQLAPMLADLAEIQSAVVEQIKRAAGKYVDRVMAVAVIDPGLWTEDFDGRRSYTSLCDATRLAELAGVTVIDAFPSRDIAAGGQGCSLDAMPLWLMLADRNAKVASQNRAVLIAQGQSRCYWLPPSDGLDAELPSIQQIDAVGFDFLQQLVERLSRSGLSRSEFEKLYANGTSLESVRNKLLATIAASDDGTNSAVGSSQLARPLGVKMNLMKVAESFLADRPDAVASLVRTSAESVVDALAISLKNQKGNLKEVCIAAMPQLESCLINRFDQLLPNVTVRPITKQGFSASGLPAVTAAMLGLLHIDQMPANIPWMSGADSQRILGRLTPGRPANWRQLVRSMADFRPPAMKLRDAV
jgi:anhydro-N-acetylmuramic acid kinase